VRGEADANASSRQTRGVERAAHVVGGMRVAQFLAQHDSGAFVSFGREGKHAAGLEHPGGGAGVAIPSPSLPFSRGGRRLRLATE